MLVDWFLVTLSICIRGYESYYFNKANLTTILSLLLRWQNSANDLLRRLRGAFFRFVGMTMGTWILWVNAWKGHLIKIETQYLLKTSSQQTFPFPPTQYKQFKPFCGIKTYLKYLLWKKNESLVMNHVINKCMNCIFWEEVSSCYPRQAIFSVDVRPLHGLSAPLVCLSIQLLLVHKPWAVEEDFCGSGQEISNLSVTW